MSDSFITLSRKILNWEWYTDSNTFRLFIHCLIKANWRQKDWRGITIPRGSFITSQDNLSNELGLTRRQIITSLTKLTKTKEIIKKGYNKYTLVTVVKYDDYQKSSDDDVQQMYNKCTADGTTDVQQMYTTNNSNNNNNSNKSNNNIINRGAEENLKLALEDEKYVGAITSSLKISKDKLEELYKEFNLHLQLRSDTVKTLTDYVSHFRSWYLKKYNINPTTGRLKLRYKNSL